MMKQYAKRSYTMKAEKVAPGTKLYNYLEDCPISLLKQNASSSLAPSTRYGL